MRLFIILCSWKSYCNGSKQVSLYNFWVLHNLVAPVSIRAASNLTFSKLRLVSRLQLSQIMSLYSNIGLTKLLYNFDNERLSRSNLCRLNAPDRLNAFSCINFVWLFHERSLDIIKPRCLCLTPPLSEYLP